MANNSKDTSDTIKQKIVSNSNYATLNAMGDEQRKTVTMQKEKEIDKILEKHGKVNYKKDISILLKSSNFLMIERLLLDGFSQKSICDYIRENLNDDVVLNKMSELTLKTSINKLKIALDNYKIIPSIKSYNKEKGEALEEKMNNIVNEQEELAFYIHLQKKRITEIRDREIMNGDVSKDMKHEIKLAQDLIKTSFEIKEKVGMVGNQVKDAFGLVKEGIKKDFSSLLNKESASAIRNFISIVISAPSQDNLIMKEEVDEIYAHNSPDIKALSEVKKKVSKGEFSSEEIFFDVKRKQSEILIDKERKELPPLINRIIRSEQTEEELSEIENELSTPIKSDNESDDDDLISDDEIMAEDGKAFDDEDDLGESYEDFDDEDEEYLDFDGEGDE